MDAGGRAAQEQLPRHEEHEDFSCKCSVPLFEKEGLGEILLDKSPSIPLFQRGR